jgi:hypothetical protein
MAAIFQLRRGSGSVSMVDGELYVNKGPDSLQYSVDEKIFTLVTLNEINSGSFSLTGDITASNAYFRNNVALGGTITIGDSTSDSVIFNADLSSSIIPDGNKIYDLGNDSKWYKTTYTETISASFISGAIAGIGNIEEFSASVDSRLDQLQLASASIQSFTASQQSKNETLAIYTASINADLEKIHQSTASLNLFSASEESKNETLAIYTGSINTKFTEVQSSTASLNTFSGSTLGRLSNLETKSASVDVSLIEIHTYTQSLKDAITVTGTGASSTTTIKGNLYVQGTQTTLDSTTIQLGDNIIELNGSGIANAGLLIKDSTSPNTLSGSLLWDTTLNYWKAGNAYLESKILLAGGDGVLSGSTDFNAFSTSVDLRIANVSSSLHDLSGSTYLVSSSLDSRVTNVSSSLYDLSGSTYSISASFDTQITNASSSLNELSGSTYSISSSFDIRITNNSSSLYELSGSSYNLSSSFDNKFTAVQSSTASLNTFSASVLSDLTSIHQTTSSLNLFSASINFFSASVFTDFSNSYDAVSESFDYRISILDPGNLSAAIDSLNLFTASTTIHLNNLESKSASVDISISSINSFTSSTNNRLNNLELTSASINAWSSSLTTTFATDAEVAAGYESQGRGIVSGSSQIVPLLPMGVVSGSIQILGGSGVWSSSVQMPAGVVSGSSQILGGSGIVSGSSQVISLLPTGVVSGSSQILGGTNIHSGSTGNYQFNSIGVNITPTGVAGEIVATGDITAFYSSDERLKENIIPIPNALEKVNQISGNTYDWKEGYDAVHSHRGNDVGVIAQEIEQILPQIVTNRDNGFKAVQYEKMIPLLIEAIKELSAKVDRLENK